MSIDRTKYLSKKEMDHLRSTMAEYAKSGFATALLDWLCVDLALQTGLRVSEMAMIMPGDVDLKRGCMYVNRLKRRQPLREIVALSPSIMEHLEEHLTRIGFLLSPIGIPGDKPLDLDAMEREVSFIKRDVFWPGERGAWTKRALQQSWARSCKRAGINGVSIHGARHTIAVELYRQTKSLLLVQKQLGHARSDITARMYADVPFEDQVEALKGVFG